jgi:hypothetical protein
LGNMPKLCGKILMDIEYVHRQEIYPLGDIIAPCLVTSLNMRVQ